MTREVASDVLDVADSSDANSVKCARVSVRQQRCEKRDIKTNNTSACVTDMPSTMKPFVFDEPESENAEEAQNAEATRPKRYFWEDEQNRRVLDAMHNVVEKEAKKGSGVSLQASRPGLQLCNINSYRPKCDDYVLLKKAKVNGDLLPFVGSVDVPRVSRVLVRRSRKGGC